MANPILVTSLPALAAPSDDDVVHFVHDPSGTPSDRKVRYDAIGRRIHKKAKRTAGDQSLNSTTWANVDTALDLVLPAVVGDEIEYGINGLSGAQAVFIDFDVVSIVAASPVNSFATDGAAVAAPGAVILGWQGPSGAAAHMAGSVLYTVVAGDISGGNVTLRLRYATNAAVNKTVYGSAASPLRVWAKNLGPVAP